MDAVRAEIERELRNEKKVALLVPQAQAFATKAAASSLEAAAREAGMPLESSPVFARVTPVLGLGRVNQAIGAAFTLPIGAVGAPVATDNAVIVMRVNRRTEASRAAFEAQKTEQRQTLVQGLREQRVRDYLANLRKTASVEDKRKELLAASRRGAGT
jgi:hypothetical protein